MDKAATIRTIALLTFVAFFVNVTLPFFAVYDVSAAVATAQAETEQNSTFFGDKILICTDDGFKFISVKELQEGHDQPKQHPQYECAMCYVAAHGTKHLMTTAEVAFVRYEHAQQVVYNISHDVTVSQFSSHSFQTRAPPFIV